MVQQVVFNGRFQFSDAGERATANAFVCDLSKEALDQVQPERRSWDEAHLESHMLGEPRLHSSRLVGRAVVNDQVQRDPLSCFTVEVLEELNELFRQVAQLTFADDDAGLQVECGEQLRRAVTLIIMHRVGGPAIFIGKPGCV